MFTYLHITFCYCLRRETFLTSVIFVQTQRPVMWWKHCLNWFCMGIACFDMSNRPFHAIMTSRRALHWGWSVRNEDIVGNRVPDSSGGCFSVAEGNNITVAAFRMFIWFYIHSLIYFMRLLLAFSLLLFYSTFRFSPQAQNHSEQKPVTMKQRGNKSH